MDVEERSHTQAFSGGTEHNQQKNLRITGLRAEIRNQHLQNMKQ